jgi:hypothetical protein
MKSMKKILGITVIALFLSSCKSDFNFDAYSTDLFIAENVKTPAEMAIEISSCTSDSFEKYKTEILSVFSTSSNAKVIDCVKKGHDSMLVISLDSLIASDENGSIEFGEFDLVLVRQVVPDGVIDGKNYEVRGVRPMMSDSFIERVKMLMKQKMQSLTFENVTLTITLNNDERDDILVSGTFLWVDGEPFERYSRQKLERRQKLELKFSKVVSDLVLRMKAPTVVFVGRLK